MKELRYTLLTDGGSDRALLPMLTWLLRQHLDSECAIQPSWADLRRLPRPPAKLEGKIRSALDLYPCDLLFVHRDAEGQPRQLRVDEIHEAVSATDEAGAVAVVCVVPVRMTEAWLLIDEKAVRFAAGNPNGRSDLPLPPAGSLDQVADPKKYLYDLLREASGLKGRRRAKFSTHGSAERVAEFIDDFRPLRALNAFRALESELDGVIQERGWS